MLQGMNPKLRVRAARSGGVFSRRDAIDSDYTAEQIRWRLATGQWRRIRRGFYAEPVAELPELAPRRSSGRAAHEHGRRWPSPTGRAESPGESRLRVLLDRHGMPRPALQTTFHDHDGFFVARVDFFFAAQRVAVEFDGLTKYGEDGREAVLAEKEREDRLRALGVSVIRVTWGELDHPELVIRRIRRAFARAA